GRHCQMELTRETRALYDRYAREYVSATESYDSFPGLREEVDGLCFRALAFGPLLDLGCGAGRDSAYLIQRGRNVIAGDLSSEMLKVTRARCNNRAPAVQLDLRVLPFRDNVFA